MAKITVSHDAVEVSNSNIAHFLPLVAGSLLKKAGGAVLRKIAASKANAAEEGESEAEVEEPSLEDDNQLVSLPSDEQEFDAQTVSLPSDEYGMFDEDTGVEQDAGVVGLSSDGASISLLNDGLAILADEEREELRSEIAADVEALENEVHDALSLLADLVANEERALESDYTESGDVQHFKKKLKKLKKLAKSGLKAATGIAGGAIPGGQIATGLISKGRGRARQAFEHHADVRSSS